MNRIVVLGGGESGVGAAVLAKQKGFEVFLSDMGVLQAQAKEMLAEHAIPFEEGRHTPEQVLNAMEVIKSPGIPDTAPMVEQLIQKGTPVISEIEFAGRYDRAKKICITGSNGKTTTTSLIYFLLKNAGLNVGMAGNIGQSYAYQVATQQHDIYVLELSSFQLDNMYDFKADLAILLNITPDHLDRYGYDMQKYINAKFRITQNMSPEDYFIFCSDDEVTVEQLNKIVLKAQKLPFSQKHPVEQGASVQDGLITSKYGEDEFKIFIDELSLQGKHNVYNSMAAAITGQVMNIRHEFIRESLMTFKGVEHRLEQVGKIRGVLYINDSKATNVNSTWYALETMKTPVVWIAGGTDKGNDYSILHDLVKTKVKALICLGEDNSKLCRDFGDKVSSITQVRSAAEAVQAAYRLAQSGDTVLLSPACASFDLFANYEDRGRQFKEAVRTL
ncbi:MAG: UDP-N-acetylmuramoyl-L-alanine--D-glutamate ligase [Bacteroidales bacterium]|nr:UDP-N-acetylmuramoyl-L-alanine--D-glutamate ligase [Bacteroidales bacterium]MCL2738511.1 UDP-N-acetylmuramoyl-L-alanine--D-glutamate ligase [Bacteroidales bacterium]